jgi:hypothetical protein
VTPPLTARPTWASSATRARPGTPGTTTNGSDRATLSQSPGAACDPPNCVVPIPPAQPVVPIDRDRCQPTIRGARSPGDRLALHANDRQRTQLRAVAGHARFVWNRGLAARRKRHQQLVKPARERGESINWLTGFDPDQRPEPGDPIDRPRRSTSRLPCVRRANRRPGRSHQGSPHGVDPHDVSPLPSAPDTVPGLALGRSGGRMGSIDGDDVAIGAAVTLAVGPGVTIAVGLRLAAGPTVQPTSNPRTAPNTARATDVVTADRIAASFVTLTAAPRSRSGRRHGPCSSGCRPAS